MDPISDEVLLSELKRRFEENKQALYNLQMLTKKLEAVNDKLKQSEELKSNFLSNIRNEINNPLAAILGSAKQLIDGRGDAATARAMAQVIHTEAFDLDFHLQNIFAAAELEAGETALSVARVDVAALIRNLMAVFSRKAAEKRLTMEFECICSGGAEGALFFRTDPEKLQKVLANLLANAVEYNREGKRVMMRAWREGSRLTVSVSDEGIGIPEADRKKVFDRFVQLDTGTKKRHKGQGLGLCITKALVEILDGTIALTGEEGRGCVFTVSFGEVGSGRDADVFSEDGNEFIFESGTQY